MKRIATAAFASVMLAGVAQAAEMTIYKQPQFTGEAVTVRNIARDLAPLGITDQASSLVVRSGRWEVCTQPDFQGDCRVLGPGRYPTLDVALNHRIESVREAERNARAGEGRYPQRGRETYGARPEVSGPVYDDRWSEGDADRWRAREDDRGQWSRESR
jgi:hypothetical protein